jgi:hypothetical protein
MNRLAAYLTTLTLTSLIAVALVPATASAWTDYPAAPRWGENDVGVRGPPGRRGPRGQTGPPGATGPQGPAGASACAASARGGSALFQLGSLPPEAWVAEGALIALFLIYVTGAAISWKRHAPARPGDELTRAANSMSNFRSVGVAGAAFLLAAIGVLLGIHPECQPPSHAAFTLLTFGAMWLVLSLSAGLVSGGYELNHVHQDRSVAENQLIMTGTAAQMAGIIAGGVSFVTALFLL